MVPGGNEVYDRIGWYEATTVQLGFIGAFILIFLSGCLAWLIVPLFRRLYGMIRTSSGESSTPESVVTSGQLEGDAGERRSLLPILQTIDPWLVGVASGLNLFFLVTFLLVMESAASTQNLHYSWIEYGVPPGVVALLCLPLATTLLAVIMPIFNIPTLADSSSSLHGRLHRTAVALAALAFTPFLLYWNLLGFHF
jgi:hypothetical protein